MFAEKSDLLKDTCEKNMNPTILAWGSCIFYLMLIPKGVCITPKTDSNQNITASTTTTFKIVLIGLAIGT